jgi:hypothetical protein
MRTLEGLEKFDWVVQIRSNAPTARFVEIQEEVRRLAQELVERWEVESACS